MNSVPKFEDSDCYFQDFGFGAYLDPKREISWHSIAEDLDFRPPLSSDHFAIDFFLQTAAKAIGAVMPTKRPGPQPS